MFQSDFLEFFSRIPPWHPPAIFGPVILYQLLRAVQLESSGWMVVGLFLGGLTFWSLMEYWLHRLVFHYEPRSNLGKRLIWILHGVHHDWPNDKMRLVFPPGLSIPLAVAFFCLFQAVLGPVHVYGAFAGLATGYLAYDMIHYATHHFTWDNPVMRYLRAYHMAHHFKHEPNRYGVTSPLWDFVFGTAPRSRADTPSSSVP